MIEGIILSNIFILKKIILTSKNNLLIKSSIKNIKFE